MRILFDLDGTINDSGEGIIRCAGLALEYFRIPVPDKETMRVFVGPPLRETFMKFGVPESGVEKAMEVYRATYLPEGIYQCHAYEGIGEVLRRLKSDGHILYIATSKPDFMAENVLNYLGLADCFHKICGATLDKARDTKEAVIDYLLHQTDTRGTAYMVGDTHYDVEGARAFGIPTVGVSWGYGKVEDMVKSGAAAIVDTPQQLYDYLSALK